jgi:hypothetical protein
MNGRQMRELQQALLDAFPSEGDLARMVSFGLDERLTAIATGTTLTETVFKLIQWAESHGKVSQLLEAAVRENPDNLQLKNIAGAFLPVLESPQPKIAIPPTPVAIRAGGDVYDHRAIHTANAPQATDIHTANAPQGADSRTQVFISYSHQDRRWLGRLQTHLRPLVRQGVIDLWDDTQIAKGADWQATIQAALARARVAVLLVTPDFLASEFVATQELPRLLEGAAQGGLTILWIAVRPSAYQRTPIARYQAANEPARPLSGLNPTQRDQVLVQICEVIARAAGLERQEEG